MNICDDGHDEVVFVSRKCPFCEANSEIDNLNNQINKLEEELKSYQEEKI